MRAIIPIVASLGTSLGTDFGLTELPGFSRAGQFFVSTGGASWLTVLDLLARENLLDTILYVDLCNEWPAQIWTPFFKARRRGHGWSTPESIDWMKRAIDPLNRKYAHIPFTF